MMKKIIFIAAALVLSFSGYAKKVKFAVDMSGQNISSNGVHVTGDFQAVAGFAGGDWQPNTTTLTQEGTTNIYSIIINIPAHQKYEYKFINGDLFYQVEFVPEESRVMYNFNDDRWVYVDSTANDTTFVGAIPYSGNAPAGHNLIRFKVGMQNETVSANNVHIAGSFQAFNPAKNTMYSFDGNTYEYITYVDSSIHTYTYKFINGNASANYESVPSACASGGNRTIIFAKDTVLDTLCFSSCTKCTSVAGIAKNKSSVNNLKLLPNPSNTFTLIQFNDNSSLHNITLTDVTGRVVKTFSTQNTSFQMDVSTLTEGLYFVSSTNDVGKTNINKLVVK